MQQRLDTTLHAYPGLRLIPIPAQFLRAPPTGGGGRRVLRGGSLPDLGDMAGEVYDMVRDLWESVGCPVDDVAGLDGRMLVVHDPAGYLVSLTRHGDDDPILTVASPPLATRLVEHDLLAGLLAGLTLGCLGPCVSSAFPALADLSAPYWSWLPLFVLVAGVTLARPETRRFGIGLAVAGALVGFTVAGIVS